MLASCAVHETPIYLTSVEPLAGAGVVDGLRGGRPLPLRPDVQLIVQDLAVAVIQLVMELLQQGVIVSGLASQR